VAHKIAGLPCTVWVELFYQCHEFRFDGGQARVKGSKKQTKTGYFSRLCWPDGGSTLKQYRIVVEIMSVIKDELTTMHLKRLG